jgi:hypothetical protein
MGSDMHVVLDSPDDHGHLCYRTDSDALASTKRSFVQVIRRTNLEKR